MTARLYYTSATAAPGPIAELTVVRLRAPTSAEAQGDLPAGSLGTIVFVHDGGEAFEVEFVEPFAAVITLRRDEFEPTEAACDNLAGAVG
jgi:Domain of unknown function (DUF4926)